MNLVAIGLLILLIVMIVDYIRIILYGFRVSAMWGIALIVSWLIPVLFFIFYIFCIKHFQDVKKPFIRMHVIIVLMVVTAFFLYGPPR